MWSKQQGVKAILAKSSTTSILHQFVIMLTICTCSKKNPVFDEIVMTFPSLPEELGKEILTLFNVCSGLTLRLKVV